jgi:hypothetical protein
MLGRFRDFAQAEEQQKSPKQRLKRPEKVLLGVWRGNPA